MSYEVEHTTFRNLSNREIGSLSKSLKHMPRHVLEAYALEVMRRFVILDNAVDRVLLKLDTPPVGGKPKLVVNNDGE